jgi:hypothetical protein
MGQGLDSLFKKALVESEKLTKNDESVIWAGMLGGNTTFGRLVTGQKFVFPGSESSVHTKLKSGWYRDTDGHRWKTGAKTAVIGITTP